MVVLLVVACIGLADAQTGNSTKINKTDTLASKSTVKPNNDSLANPKIKQILTDTAKQVGTKPINNVAISDSAKKTQPAKPTENPKRVGKSSVEQEPAKPTENPDRVASKTEDVSELNESSNMLNWNWVRANRKVLELNDQKFTLVIEKTEEKKPIKISVFFSFKAEKYLIVDQSYATTEIDNTIKLKEFLSGINFAEKSKAFEGWKKVITQIYGNNVKVQYVKNKMGKIAALKKDRILLDNLARPQLFDPSKRDKFINQVVSDVKDKFEALKPIEQLASIDIPIDWFGTIKQKTIKLNENKDFVLSFEAVREYPDRDIVRIKLTYKDKNGASIGPLFDKSYDLDAVNKAVGLNNTLTEIATKETSAILDAWAAALKKIDPKASTGSDGVKMANVTADAASPIGDLKDVKRPNFLAADKAKRAAAVTEVVDEVLNVKKNDNTPKTNWSKLGDIAQAQGHLAGILSIKRPNALPSTANESNYSGGLSNQSLFARPLATQIPVKNIELFDMRAGHYVRHSFFYIINSNPEDNPLLKIYSNRRLAYEWNRYCELTLKNNRGISEIREEIFKVLNLKNQTTKIEYQNIQTSLANLNKIIDTLTILNNVKKKAISDIIKKSLNSLESDSKEIGNSIFNFASSRKTIQSIEEIVDNAVYAYQPAIRRRKIYMPLSFNYRPYKILTNITAWQNFQLWLLQKDAGMASQPAKLSTEGESTKSEPDPFEKYQIKFDRGSITEVIIATKGDREYRFQGNVPVKAFTEWSNFDDMMLNPHNHESISIPLNQVLQYTPFLLDNTDDYSPADTVIVGSFSDDVVTEKVPLRGKSIRTQLSLFTYSDVLGLLFNQPNGIIQVDGGLDLMLRGRRLSKWYCPSWLESARLDFVASLPNSNFFHLPVRYEGGQNVYETFNDTATKNLGQRFFNVFDVLRYSKIRISPRLNLFTWNVPTQTLILRTYLEGSSILNFMSDTSFSTKITQRDSSRTETRSSVTRQFTNISATYGLGFNIEYKQPQYRVYGDLYWFNMLTHQLGEDLALDRGHLVSDPYSRNVFTPVSNTIEYRVPWMADIPLPNLPYTRLSASVNWYLDKDQTKSLSARVQHFFSFYNDGRGNFWQIQLGYNYVFGVGAPITSNQGIRDYLKP